MKKNTIEWDFLFLSTALLNFILFLAFRPHLNLPRARGVVGALHRLLPNFGGPLEELCSPYMGVVRCMVLYEAPVWSKDLARSSSYKAQLGSLQRLMDIRIVRDYRTISYEAATNLARSPPFDILADMETMVLRPNSFCRSQWRRGSAGSWAWNASAERTYEELRACRARATSRGELAAANDSRSATPWCVRGICPR